MRYVVVIHKDEGSDYGVTVPDLPGCFSAGDTLDQALSNSTEAIECHIEGLFSDSEELPTPQPSETHINNPDYDNAIFAVVDVDLSNISGSTKRINISMPENVLSKIDRFVDSQGGSRSAFLAEASLEYMANRSISSKRSSISFSKGKRIIRPENKSSHQIINKIEPKKGKKASKKNRESPGT
jgi:predicted RNase H-like HicB family nuclease